MTYVLDTGFFFALLTGPNAQVEKAWGQIGRGDARGVVSAVTGFELYRHRLRGILPQSPVEQLLQDLPRVCTVVPVSNFEQADRVARLSHGNGLSMADAFILEAALRHGAGRLYTSDTDFERYEGDVRIILI